MTSGQNISHYTTAKRSVHVWNHDLIWWQNKIDTQKHFRETTITSSWTLSKTKIPITIVKAQMPSKPKSEVPHAGQWKTLEIPASGPKTPTRASHGVYVESCELFGQTIRVQPCQAVRARSLVWSQEQHRRKIPTAGGGETSLAEVGFGASYASCFWCVVEILCHQSKCISPVAATGEIQMFHHWLMKARAYSIVSVGKIIRALEPPWMSKHVMLDKAMCTTVTQVINHSNSFKQRHNCKEWWLFSI